MEMIGQGQFMNCTYNGNIDAIKQQIRKT